MKYTPRLGIGLFIAIVASVLAGSAEAEPPPGFRPLFNGEDLAGWCGIPRSDPRKLAAMTDEERQKQIDQWWGETVAHWKVVAGELLNDGKGPYLTTDRDYGDIELLVEYRTIPLTDSGIYLRGTPQVQIWDWTAAGGKWNLGADKGSGGLYNNPKDAPGRDPLVLADKPFGEWNKFRILQVGARTSVWLNDRLVVDHARQHNSWNRDAPLHHSGRIQLQTHGGEIRWRNLFIREIPPYEANSILASHADDGYVSVFNGKDFTGWRGQTDRFEIVDHAIACKRGDQGCILTQQSYDDFRVRFEFRHLAGGRGGLVVRHPGDDKSASTGASRQSHFPKYDLVPAFREYLRTGGEWNFLEVAVIGPRITYELNGAIILDRNLDEAPELIKDISPAGDVRSAGHFGFAGHNDPVRFRRIRIKKVESATASGARQNASSGM